MNINDTGSESLQSDPIPHGAELWTSHDYGGSCFQPNMGEWPDIGPFKHRVNSIKIRPGCKLVYYPLINFKGTPKDLHYGSNTPHFTDPIASVKMARMSQVDVSLPTVGVVEAAPFPFGASLHTNDNFEGSFFPAHLGDWPDIGPFKQRVGSIKPQPGFKIIYFPEVGFQGSAKDIQSGSEVKQFRDPIASMRVVPQ